MGHKIAWPILEMSVCHSVPSFTWLGKRLVLLSSEMQCCWLSSSFQSILWCTARRHCRNVNDCLGSSIGLLWSVQLPGKSALRCIRENVSSWMKQRRCWQRWMRRREKCARYKEKHGWVTSAWEKEVGMNEGGQYTNGRGWCWVESEVRGWKDLRQCWTTRRKKEKAKGKSTSKYESI